MMGACPPSTPKRGSRFVSPMPVRLATEALLRVSDQAGRVVRSEALRADSLSHRAIAIRWVASAVVCYLGIGLPTGGRSQPMTADIPHRVVPSPAPSELQQLAEWFHQDWKLVFPDFYAGLDLYLDNLPAERRAILGRELCQFVEQNRGASA